MYGTESNLTDLKIICGQKLSQVELTVLINIHVPLRSVESLYSVCQKVPDSSCHRLASGHVSPALVHPRFESVSQGKMQSTKKKQRAAAPDHGNEEKLKVENSLQLVESYPLVTPVQLLVLEYFSVEDLAELQRLSKDMLSLIKKQVATRRSISVTVTDRSFHQWYRFLALLPQCHRLQSLVLLDKCNWIPRTKLRTVQQLLLHAVCQNKSLQVFQSERRLLTTQTIRALAQRPLTRFDAVGVADAAAADGGYDSAVLEVVRSTTTALVDIAMFPELLKPSTDRALLTLLSLRPLKSLSSNDCSFGLVLEKLPTWSTTLEELSLRNPAERSRLLEQVAELLATLTVLRSLTVDAPQSSGAGVVWILPPLLTHLRLTAWKAPELIVSGLRSAIVTVTCNLRQVLDELCNSNAASLTELAALCTVPESVLLPVLSKLTNLRQLELGGFWQDFDGPATELKQHDHLTELSLSSWSDLVFSVTAPRLTNLRMVGDDCPELDEGRLKLLLRSFPRLRSLELSFRHSSQTATEKYLRSLTDMQPTPPLVALTITGPPQPAHAQPNVTAIQHDILGRVMHRLTRLTLYIGVRLTGMADRYAKESTFAKQGRIILLPTRD
jgi:hypothetical protein